MANTSPEPVSNIVLSVAEDGVVAGMVALALAFPVVAGVVATVFAIASVAVTWMLLKFVRKYWRRWQARRHGRSAFHAMTEQLHPGRTAVATAPVRVADVGGWTDTWFGSPGSVCHVAVGPGVRVEAGLVDAPWHPAPHARPRCRPTRWATPCWTMRCRPRSTGIDLPAGVGLEVTITSAVPPGASLGTSASVLVALLGALDELVGGGRRLPADLAVLAHQVETVRAGREAGVQDQWAAAMGGVGLLAIGPYPDVRHEAIGVRPAALNDLRERLVTVVFGAHDSSLVHAQVINALVGCGGDEHDRARQALRRMSTLAGDAASALADGDVDQWAEVLVAATDAQRQLHAGLVGAPHQAAIDAAGQLGAAGWKVNGAGGDGGSLTVVSGVGHGAASADELAAALGAIDPAWRVVDLRPVVGRTRRRGRRPVRPAPPGHR